MLKNMNIECPDCGKPLKWMSEYRMGSYHTAVFHCEDCKDGIDSDWTVICDDNGTILRIERCYFG